MKRILRALVWGMTSLSVLFSCKPQEDSTIPVESISVNPTSLTLEEGETANISATVNPSNATDKTVTWSSSSTAVATVKEGVVTAVKEGSATITAKAGGKTATCAGRRQDGHLRGESAGQIRRRNVGHPGQDLAGNDGG